MADFPDVPDSGRGSVLAARNQAIDGVLEALESGLDVEGLFWVDDDLLMPAYALTAIAARSNQ